MLMGQKYNVENICHINNAILVFFVHNRTTNTDIGGLLVSCF